MSRSVPMTPTTTCSSPAQACPRRRNTNRSSTLTELGDSATQAVAVGEPLIADLCVSAARRDASGRI